MAPSREKVLMIVIGAVLCRCESGCQNPLKDLSIVIPARNDGHGGDFINRLRNTLLLASRFSWEETDLEIEIVVVAWADPKAAIPIHEAVRLGHCRKSQTCDREDEYWHDNNVVIRFLVVPQLYHDEVYNPLGLGMPQYIAKNVGMRRACGSQILITNADCLLPWTFLNHIAWVVKDAKHQDTQRRITDLETVRGTPFLLASRHDLLRPMSNVEEDEVLHTHVGTTGVSLRELTGDRCRQRGFHNVFAETNKFSTLLNIGDFLFISWAAINVTLGYSEHHQPFGLDGELVCRLALKHAMQPRLLFPPCAVIHQPHPHAYNFSHPPFPWQHVCQQYADGRGAKDERGRERDEEEEWGVRREWGFPRWRLTEHVLFPSGRMLTDHPELTDEGQEQKIK